LLLEDRGGLFFTIQGAAFFFWPLPPSLLPPLPGALLVEEFALLLGVDGAAGAGDELNLFVLELSLLLSPSSPSPSPSPSSAMASEVTDAASALLLFVTSLSRWWSPAIESSAADSTSAKEASCTEESRMLGSSSGGPAAADAADVFGFESDVLVPVKEDRREVAVPLLVPLTEERLDMEEVALDDALSEVRRLLAVELVLLLKEERRLAELTDAALGSTNGFT
jgi:hypothetical protein